eukprot:UN11777
MYCGVFGFNRFFFFRALNFFNFRSLGFHFSSLNKEMNNVMKLQSTFGFSFTGIFRGFSPCKIRVCLTVPFS